VTFAGSLRHRAIVVPAGAVAAFYPGGVALPPGRNHEGTRATKPTKGGHAAERRTSARVCQGGQHGAPVGTAFFPHLPIVTFAGSLRHRAIVVPAGRARGLGLAVRAGARTEPRRRRGRLAGGEPRPIIEPVSAVIPLHVIALFVATGLSIWAAVIARSRRAAPGSQAFSWLMLAVAHWCLMGALHVLVPDPDARRLILTVKYAAIASLAVLWLFFTSGYARVSWPTIPAVRVLLWIVPAITIAAAVTNPSHQLLWRGFEVMPSAWGPLPVYQPGPWFWVHVAYSYTLMLIGCWMLAHGVRRYPLPYRPQMGAVLVGAVVPFLASAYYLWWLLPIGGIDITPLAFTLSGWAFTWGLYRYRLFGLVPIARDMVVDSMEDGVLVLDGDRRIVELNHGAERLTGCTPASVGQPMDRAVPWWSDAQAETRGSAEQPAVVRVEPGPRFLEVRVSPVRNRERHFSGWLVVMRDVTARRRAEAERYALERRLQEQQKNESLTVFAAGVAHDFNNLLTGILGNADLLAMQARPDSVERRTAQEIVLSSQRAADLVSKMLAYAGEGRVVAERVDLGVLVREMVDVLSASAARHCTITYRSSGPLPPVDVDPTQIRQVVLNLLTNAAEAVEEGGLVTVVTGQESLDRAALARMTYGSDIEPGPYVFIDVVDNGHGIDDDTLARMFDPFFSTRDQGRGLGLAAVRGIVRSHQAALRVTSAPGQGSRFRVWLSLMPGRQSRPAMR
jgi:PAS domain S-box-containing protein